MFSFSSLDTSGWAAVRVMSRACNAGHPLGLPTICTYCHTLPAWCSCELLTAAQGGRPRLAQGPTELSRSVQSRLEMRSHTGNSLSLSLSSIKRITLYIQYNTWLGLKPPVRHSHPWWLDAWQRDCGSGRSRPGQHQEPGPRLRDGPPWRLYMHMLRPPFMRSISWLNPLLALMYTVIEIMVTVYYMIRLTYI